ncbi:MAG: hypothetical protein KY469_18275 [Actinobacteria bacterium]|nr:hypothetical protein [Actinomycetota bacterium]
MEAHMILNEAAQLTVQEVRELALAYRRWADVLAGSLGSVPPATMLAIGPLAPSIHRALIRDADLVSPCDQEDAAMAVYLHALADALGDDSSIVDLLRGPWNTFRETVRVAAPA